MKIRIGVTLLLCLILSNFLIAQTKSAFSDWALLEKNNFFPLKIEDIKTPYWINYFSSDFLTKQNAGFGLFSTFSDFDVFGRYEVHYLSPAGVQINRLAGGVSYKVPLLSGVKIGVGGESFSKGAGVLKKETSASFKWRLETSLEPISGLELASTLSGGRLGRENLLLGAQIKLKNYLLTGSDFFIEGYKVGNTYYQDGFEIPLQSAFLNNYGELLSSGKKSVSAGLAQRFFKDSLTLLGKVNVNFDKDYKNAVWQLGVAYNIAAFAQLEAGYRKRLASSGNDPTKDYLTAGLNLEF